MDPIPPILPGHRLRDLMDQAPMICAAAKAQAISDAQSCKADTPVTHAYLALMHCQRVVELTRVSDRARESFPPEVVADMAAMNHSAREVFAYLIHQLDIAVFPATPAEH
ncbi:hypothetical protein OKA04_04555 [Luteolibacter flavescens]|uniref:Uncharacterized protein n=1 Tax=Luteolibacter flavescens TaxID=1859460 RepID=A0ABT3FKK7_9BACT|nr:hypothetical protein [Luteolibacter flavescens]MCW1883987.1 hypothetical protein [Luteolibacter flavescens]